MENTNFYQYPFTAIVDQEELKKALLLNAVNPQIRGVLIRGGSGTAKSTAVRGLLELLPEIKVVEGCPFNCDPEQVDSQCPSCQEKRLRGEKLPVSTRRRKLVNLPLNATEDRVAGSIDISKALAEGYKSFAPGLLAEANRGILYIDEINLLDDQIIDILLDAAALGVNIVEREGISFSHPSRFFIIGTMNPEEGELRPQIADRIGLHINVSAIDEADKRVEVMKRYDSFLSDPVKFRQEYASAQNKLKATIQQAIDLLSELTFPPELYYVIARLTAYFKVTSHRADITISQCARALAALEGRQTVKLDHIKEAAYLALGHRLPKDPFEPGPALERRDVERQVEIIKEAIEEKKTLTGPKKQ
ncbi:MAG: magnesium chelatase [Firmicutes bacterium]|nr:magnesium chelatase [Bacillota bacterium]